jgi:hypothetical protein
MHYGDNDDPYDPGNNDPEREAHESEPEKHAIHWPRVFVAVLFALLGVGAALAWHYNGADGLKSSPPADPQEATVRLKDFQRYQQATTADIQEDKDKLQEQSAKIRQLSDQIAQLNATLNALETAAREAQASAHAAQKGSKKH